MTANGAAGREKVRVPNTYSKANAQTPAAQRHNSARTNRKGAVGSSNELEALVTVQGHHARIQVHPSFLPEQREREVEGKRL